MNAAQTKLYWKAWQAAAHAHGWTTKTGIAAALQSPGSGAVWVSPELNQTLSSIHAIARAVAQDDGRDVTANDMRHACSAVALGRPKSSKRFTNADLDRVLALLRLLADPLNLKNLVTHQDGGESGERRRHVHVITQSPAAYWQSIARDKFGQSDLDRLTLAQLRQLSLTIRNRRCAPRPNPAAAPQPTLLAA